MEKTNELEPIDAQPTVCQGDDHDDGLAEDRRQLLPKVRFFGEAIRPLNYSLGLRQEPW